MMVGCLAASDAKGTISKFAVSRQDLRRAERPSALPHSFTR